VVSLVLEQRKRQDLVEQQKIPLSAAESEEELDMDANVLTQTHMIVRHGLQLDSVPIQITFTI